MRLPSFAQFVVFYAYDAVQPLNDPLVGAESGVQVEYYDRRAIALDPGDMPMQETLLFYSPDPTDDKPRVHAVPVLFNLN